MTEDLICDEAFLSFDAVNSLCVVVDTVVIIKSCIDESAIVVANKNDGHILQAPMCSCLPRINVIAIHMIGK